MPAGKRMLDLWRRAAVLAALALLTVMTPLAPAATMTMQSADEGATKSARPPRPTEQQRKSYEQTEIKQPANFDECVRVALIQSPHLLKSSLEIEVKKLDEGDAMSQYIPTITIGTTYYLRNPSADKINPSQSDLDQKPYTFNFTAGGWNPVQTFFDNKAKEGLTKVAIEAHLNAINTGIKQLATFFLQSGFVDKLLEISAQRLELARQNLQYVQTRVSLGYSKPLDLQIAQTRVDMAQAERDKFEANRATFLNEIKSLLGIPPTQKMALDLTDFTTQVMRSFTPDKATPDKAREASFELRQAEIERDLQKKSIVLAYVKYLPQLGFTLTTPDPVNQAANTRWGIYPGITLNLPLDWLTKTRDVSRQQFKLEQLLTTMRVTGVKVENTLQTALSNYRSFESQAKMSAAKTELARLTEKQTAMVFQGSQTDPEKGKVDYEKLLQDRLAYLDNKQAALTDEYNRDIYLLELKFLSGDLRRQYVNVAPMEIFQ